MVQTDNGCNVSNPNDEILNYLTTAPASVFAGQPVDLLDHWAGEANLLWRVESRGQEAVLKLYLDAGQVRSRREFDGQTLLAPFGLAPPPLWLDRIPETLPRSVLVYRWVAGEPFDAADGRQWDALAAALAQVHRAPVEDLQRFSPHPVNLAYFWSVLGPSLPPLQVGLASRRLLRLSDVVGRLHAAGQRAVDAALPLWAAAPAAVHGDLRLDNVLNSFGAPVLLDWELFGLGDPALEVARFLHTHRQAIDPLLLESWLDAYLGHLGDATAPARIDLYRRQLLPLQDAAYLLNGGVKLTAAERQSPELHADAALLAEALRRALAQAGPALGGGNIHDDEGAAAECAALFSEEITL